MILTRLNSVDVELEENIKIPRRAFSLEGITKKLKYEKNEKTSIRLIVPSYNIIAM